MQDGGVVGVADGVPVADRHRKADVDANVTRGAGDGFDLVDVRQAALHAGVVDHEVGHAVPHRSGEGRGRAQVGVGRGRDAEEGQPPFQRPRKGAEGGATEGAGVIVGVG